MSKQRYFKCNICGEMQRIQEDDYDQHGDMTANLERNYFRIGAMYINEYGQTVLDKDLLMEYELCPNCMEKVMEAIDILMKEANKE